MEFRKFLTRFLLLMIFLAPACAQKSGENFIGSENAMPLLELVSSGGLMGMHRKITVDNSGKMTLHNYRDNTDSMHMLSSSDLEEIKKIVYQLPALQLNHKRNCPDCIQYQLIFVRNEQTHKVDLTAPLPANSPYHPLLEKLIIISKSVSQEGN